MAGVEVLPPKLVDIGACCVIGGSYMFLFLRCGLTRGGGWAKLMKEYAHPLVAVGVGRWWEVSQFVDIGVHVHV